MLSSYWESYDTGISRSKKINSFWHTNISCLPFSRWNLLSTKEKVIHWMNECFFTYIQIERINIYKRVHCSRSSFSSIFLLPVTCVQWKRVSKNKHIKQINTTHFRKTKAFKRSSILWNYKFFFATISPDTFYCIKIQQKKGIAEFILNKIFFIRLGLTTRGSWVCP